LHRLKRGIMGLVPGLLVLSFTGCTGVNPWMQADMLFKEKKYPEAADAYAKAAEKYPQRREPVFNRGASLHMSQDYDRAIKTFQTLAREASDELQQRSEYNTGNGYLCKGEAKDAIEHYKRALYLKSDDMNAKWNLELAQRKQQQQQQKQNQQQGKQKDQQQQKSKQDKKQSQKDQQQAKPRQQQVPKQNGQLSKKEAERLLSALAGQDKELQKQLRQPHAPIQRPAYGKDW